MASEGRLRAAVAACAAGLATLGVVAGAFLDAPRVVVACALGMALLFAVLLRALRALRVALRVPAPEVLPLTPDQRALLDSALALEARLEHAPIALFRVDAAPAEAVTALNANARRLLAPGRAADPQALYAQLRALPVDTRRLVSFQTERGDERALAAVSAVTLRGVVGRIVALMPVESELEAAALQAWQQLVHVLTHEIMNSLTPVASLSRTAFDLLEELKPQLPADANLDLQVALDAIGRRADSLVSFVGSYRSLSNLPAATPELVLVTDLFARVGMLVGAAWQARGGQVDFAAEPPTLEVRADPGQLEQALINLLKNAAEATAGLAQPRASVRARLARGGRLRIEVSDNGPGVPDELAGSIFTPFFSTRKQGSGIGLAMVRHLVHANGGTVRYARPAQGGARFVITF